MHPRIPTAAFVLGSTLGLAGCAADSSDDSAAVSEFLYVWAAHPDPEGSSFLSVLGADPASPGYGRVLATTTGDRERSGASHRARSCQQATDFLPMR